MRANISSPGRVESRGAMRMRLEVEGDLDARNVRRALEALEAFRTAGCVQVDLRRTGQVDPEALVLLLAGLDALALPEVRCEGVTGALRVMLDSLGRHPLTLRALGPRA